MKYAVRIFPLLLVLGIIFVGCYLKSDFGVKTERYTGPQTVDALMETFDARYSATAAQWASETSNGKKRYIEFTLADMDAKYPRDAWLQTLLNKGLTIDNFKRYSEYLNIRADLILEEFYTDANWETVKASYIDTQLQNHQHIAEANQAHPQVENYFMVGENALPQIPGRIYVLKTESRATIWHTRTETKLETGEILSVKGSELSDRQRLNLLNTGAVPKGWEVVYVDEDGNPIR